ncbi:class I SAM-dependent methyltransferase [Actinoplanes sp. HUAS TT8]|uniref:class I SAM-dependent methyltransferase n=1 Tax=Actinoplanes sp. HUAS TT8 TaxID=3447453 RepID=UPI003F51D7EE
MADIPWQAGDAYEAYMGRWSRHVAQLFVAWLGVPGGRRWLDVGCGTGALSAQIPEPALIVGVDRSHGFLSAWQGGSRPPADKHQSRRDTARTQAGPAPAQAGPAPVQAGPAPARAGSPEVQADGRRVQGGGRWGLVGDAAGLPLADARFDAVVSGLALNFVPRPEAAVAELSRVAAPGAVIAAYVWDYANGMPMMRHFWAAAAELDPGLGERDESLGYAFCRDDVLAGWWSDAGLHAVTTRRIEIPMFFRDFDDFWTPFLGGQGPAPGYLASRSPAQQHDLRESLRHRLPVRADGAIALTAAAWAVQGRKPG